MTLGFEVLVQSSNVEHRPLLIVVIYNDLISTPKFITKGKLTNDSLGSAVSYKRYSIKVGLLKLVIRGIEEAR